MQRLGDSKSGGSGSVRAHRARGASTTWGRGADFQGFLGAIDDARRHSTSLYMVKRFRRLGIGDSVAAHVEPASPAASPYALFFDWASDAWGSATTESEFPPIQWPSTEQARLLVASLLSSAAIADEGAVSASVDTPWGLLSARLRGAIADDDAAWVKRTFVVENWEAILNFLESRPQLVGVLREVPARVYRHFGDDQVIALELYRDVGEQVGRLVAAIRTELAAEDAIGRLDEIDREWWFAEAATLGGSLLLTIEFV